MNELNYEKVFNVLTARLECYCVEHKIKALVLGISGGIDSTVVAAIAREVCDRIHIPLIGRSLPIKNKNDEFDVSKLVGEAFCDDFKINNLSDLYTNTLDYFSDDGESGTDISRGNIQARLRMIYLYNLASIHKGMVLSTDNQTEYQLGFWTIHGDVGDYDPIQALWKTEVYKLAAYIHDREENETIEYLANKFSNVPITEEIQVYMAKAVETSILRCKAIQASMDLTPTDGLGISNSDLDQIGANSYEEVDEILQKLLIPKNQNEHLLTNEYLKAKYDEETIDKIWDRHLKSEFKRLKAPISVPRSELI